MMNAKEFYDAGQLSEAIKAVTEQVKSQPNVIEHRGFLCELLLVAREWERADKQLDVIGHQNPQAITGVSLWRQLLRASQAREQFFRDGRVPEVLATPDALLRKYLQASVLMREQKFAEATEALAQAEQLRPHCSGKINDHNFSDLRDLDDLAPGILELFTSTGKYYWVPLSRVLSIEFFPPESALDIVFRRAHIEITEEGPEGDVYLPSVYHRLPEKDPEPCLLARTTDWLASENAPVIGLGQKMFLYDDEAISILEIEQLQINH